MKILSSLLNLWGLRIENLLGWKFQISKQINIKIWQFNTWPVRLSSVFKMPLPTKCVGSLTGFQKIQWSACRWNPCLIRMHAKTWGVSSWDGWILGTNKGAKKKPLSFGLFGIKLLQWILESQSRLHYASRLPAMGGKRRSQLCTDFGIIFMPAEHGNLPTKLSIWWFMDLHVQVHCSQVEPNPFL